MALSLVGKAAIDQLRNHRHHFIDVVRSTRLDVRRANTERTHIVVVRLDIARRNFVYRLTALNRGSVNFVINVRNVACKRQLVSASQQPSQQVENDRGSCVADMRVVINRRATQIHRHLAFL